MKELNFRVLRDDAIVEAFDCLSDTDIVDAWNEYIEQGGVGCKIVEMNSDNFNEAVDDEGLSAWEVRDLSDVDLTDEYLVLDGGNLRSIGSYSDEVDTDEEDFREYIVDNAENLISADDIRDSFFSAYKEWLDEDELEGEDILLDCLADFMADHNILGGDWAVLIPKFHECVTPNDAEKVVRLTEEIARLKEEVENLEEENARLRKVEEKYNAIVSAVRE